MSWFSTRWDKPKRRLEVTGQNMGHRLGNSVQKLVHSLGVWVSVLCPTGGFGGEGVHTSSLDLRRVVMAG